MACLLFCGGKTWVGKNSSQQRPDTYFPSKTFALHLAHLFHGPLNSLCSPTTAPSWFLISPTNHYNLDCPSGPIHTVSMSLRVQLKPYLLQEASPDLSSHSVLCPLMICYVFEASSATTSYCPWSVSSAALRTHTHTNTHVPS